MTAAVAALLFCVLLVAAAQGSVAVIDRHAGIGHSEPSWAQWCVRGHARADRVRIAFCARVDGIVVYSSRGPGWGEAHVAVVGDFHLTVVKLPAYTAIPSLGTRIVAIGPMFRARNGQREVQAFMLQRS